MLAGRALHKTMHPMTPGKLRDDFDPDNALDTGTIPLVWVAVDRHPVLEIYVRCYFGEEVRRRGWSVTFRGSHASC